MKKPELKEALQARFSNIAQEIEGIDENKFFALIHEKWSIAENLLHLTQSAKVLNQALAMPKDVLITQFGKLERPIMEYDEIVSNYLAVLATGLKARGAFIPVLPENPSKEMLLNSFIKHHEILANYLDGFSEIELDQITIPHPVLKLLSTREMYYFMQYHLEHHQKAIRRAI